MVFGRCHLVSGRGKVVSRWFQMVLGKGKMVSEILLDVLGKLLHGLGKLSGGLKGVRLSWNSVVLIAWPCFESYI